MLLKTPPSSPISSRAAAGDRREHPDRPDHDRAHRHRQDGRGGQNRQDGDQDLTVPEAPDLAEDGLHRRRDAYYRPHLVIAAVTALTLFLVKDRIVQGVERDAARRLQRFLRRQGLERPGKERARHRRAGRALHLFDVLHDVGREAGRSGNLHGGGHVGERLDTVAPVDHQRFERRGPRDRPGAQLAQLLDEAPRHVGALLQHCRLDARHHRLGEAADRLLVLLDQGRGLPLDGHDGRDAESDDQDSHDQEGDLEREPRAQHRPLLNAPRPAGPQPRDGLQRAQPRAGIIGPV
jgi:hypothetical protein